MKTSIKDVRDFPGWGERHVEMMNGQATQMCFCAFFFFCKGLKIWVRAARVQVRDGKWDAHLTWGEVKWALKHYVQNISEISKHVFFKVPALKIAANPAGFIRFP